MVLIAYATRGGTGEPAHLHSLARAFAVRTHILEPDAGSDQNQIAYPLDGYACAFDK